MLLTIILPLVAAGVIGVGLMSRTVLGRLTRTSAALARSEAQARHEAKHDSLSGLPNRVHMVERIEGFLHSPVAKRTGQRAVAAYIDIDRFKDINDTLGHEAGDQLIAAVAQRLVGRLRAQDFLSRFGGDEFAIMCAPAGHEAAATLARRIAQAFKSPFSVKGQNIRVTASVGLAIAPENGTSADELMRHADIALYEAKNQGRDRAVLFCTEMAKQVEHRRSIELALRHALEDDELELHYQPIISCQTGAVIGVEALLRWQHPIYGEMSPADFIPIAENAGLLPSLGEWVLNCAMTDAAKWPKLEVSVNLSPVQMRHVDLEGTLRRLVAEHGVDPRRFTLEITEDVMMEATDRVNAILDAIRAMGFKTALDDFGTGYSSLSYLCRFRFDKIKIDRSFVAKIAEIELDADDHQVGGQSRPCFGHEHRRRRRRDRVRSRDDAAVRLHGAPGLLFRSPAECRSNGRLPQELPAPSQAVRSFSVPRRDKQLDTRPPDLPGKVTKPCRTASRGPLLPTKTPSPDQPARSASRNADYRGLSSTPKPIFSITTASRIPTMTASFASRLPP